MRIVLTSILLLVPFASACIAESGSPAEKAEKTVPTGEFLRMLQQRQPDAAQRRELVEIQFRSSGKAGMPTMYLAVVSHEEGSRRLSLFHYERDPARPNIDPTKAMKAIKARADVTQDHTGTQLAIHQTKLRVKYGMLPELFSVGSFQWSRQLLEKQADKIKVSKISGEDSSWFFVSMEDSISLGKDRRGVLRLWYSQADLNLSRLEFAFHGRDLDGDGQRDMTSVGLSFVQDPRRIEDLTKGITRLSDQDVESRKDYQILDLASLMER